jgi:dihydropyrimidinase
MTSGQQVDLVIRGGTVITASSHFQTDVGVRGEQIVQLGGVMTGAKEIDATGKLVLPGGIDMHVHLTGVLVDGQEFSWADDFNTGTRAAAAGGITTVGNITFPHPGEPLLTTIDRTVAEVSPLAVVDYALHPVVLDPSANARAQLAELVARGHTSIKIFMILGNFDGRAREYLEMMHEAAKQGMISLIHCEDACVIGHLTQRLIAAGRTGPEWYPAAAPVFAEEIAVARAVGFAQAAEAPIYIVHLSSEKALEACHRARADGVPVYVETRPLYLYLTEQRFQEPDGAKYVGNPPLRDEDDVRALWNGIWDGDIQTFCTDHAPWTLAEKLDPSLDVGSFRPGVADLETLLPMLYSEGVRKNRISIHRFVEVTSTNAARLFGLFPRKGTIAVGSDADITIWDPELSKPVTAKGMETRSDYSPYEGWEVTGWPVTTISRGEIVYENGEVTAAAGRGRLVHRGPTQML